MTSIEGASSEMRDAEIPTCSSKEGRWNGREIALVLKSGERVGQLISHLRPAEGRPQHYAHLMRANALIGYDRSSPLERNNRSSRSPLDEEEARRRRNQQRNLPSLPGRITPPSPKLPALPKPPVPPPDKSLQPVKLTPPPKPPSPPPKPVPIVDSPKPVAPSTSSSPKPPVSPPSVAVSSAPAQHTPPPAAKPLPSSPSKPSTEKPSSSSSAPLTTKPTHPISSSGNNLASPPSKPVTLPLPPPKLPPSHDGLFGPSSVKEPLSSSSSSGRKGEDPFAPFMFSPPLTAAPGHVPIEPASLPSKTATTKVEPPKPALPPAPSFPLPGAPLHKMEFISIEKLLASNPLPKTAQADISPIIDINIRGNLAAGVGANYVSEDATLKVSAETIIDHKKNVDNNLVVSKKSKDGHKEMSLAVQENPDGIAVEVGLKKVF